MAKRMIWVILLLALALRLIFALTGDPLAPYAEASGDSSWYLGNGYALVTGHDPPGMVTDVSNLAPPPLYLLILGVAEAILEPANAVIAVRILQALFSTATCYFAYRLAWRLTQRESAGLLAALMLAISPAFVIELSQILTETTYIFLVAGAIWLFVEATQSAPLSRRSLSLLLIAAALLGLATLTRAVLLLFPFGLAILILMIYGWRGWRRAALFLLVCALVVSTWTVYSLARWNRFVIAGEGLPAFLYLGAAGWNGAQSVDQQLEQQSPDLNYSEAAEASITSDPLDWVKHRLSEWTSAYLQPHGTTFFAGESLRDLALNWLRDDRSIGGLIALTRGDAFWQKLALYLFHYAGLIFGLIGMWMYRRRWQIALPMIGFIAYVSLVHLVLYALPRYLFPTEVFWWIFAAAALIRLFVHQRVPAQSTLEQA